MRSRSRRTRKLVAQIHLLNPGDDPLHDQAVDDAHSDRRANDLSRTSRVCRSRTTRSRCRRTTQSSSTLDTCDLIGADADAAWRLAAARLQDLLRARALPRPRHRASTIDALMPDDTIDAVLTTSAGIGDSLGGADRSAFRRFTDTRACGSRATTTTAPATAILWGTAATRCACSSRSPTRRTTTAVA